MDRGHIHIYFFLFIEHQKFSIKKIQFPSFSIVLIIYYTNYKL